jgi:hypothetical protein
MSEDINYAQENRHKAEVLNELIPIIDIKINDEDEVQIHYTIEDETVTYEDPHRAFLFLIGIELGIELQEQMIHMDNIMRTNPQGWVQC